MRRILVFIIAISLFYQVFGHLLVFNANMFLCKKEMKSLIKAGLPDADKQFFKFSTADYNNLHWHNHKEFSLNNKMYDIISTERIGKDTILVSCINDEKEEELFAGLTELLDQNSDLTSTGKPITKILLKLLKTDGCLKTPENNVLLAGIVIPYKNEQFHIVNKCLTINPPPPRIIL